TDRLRVGALNWRGEVLFEPRYEDLGDFCCGTAPFSPGENNPTYGLVRISGDIILPPTLFRIGEFSDGLAPAARSRQEWGFVGLEGEWVIEPKYRQVKPFSGGLACVMIADSTRRGKKGFANAKG